CSSVAPTMSQGHTVSTHAEDVHVEVRLDGEVVASAQRPVLLEETGLPTAYYLPKADLVADVRALELSTHCPFKGDASYWTIEAGGRTHDAIAWSYEQPKEGAEEITGHVAFFADRAEILVDGTPV
ncbi:MAG: DUF427 domain-containing protein, partial [Ilumatobacter sp.]|uniref:DUF427 domain-containing protein n=1 Tax=Ilumatobacter sp. TaxID=1967498 RepID=UPI003C7523E9